MGDSLHLSVFVFLSVFCAASSGLPCPEPEDISPCVCTVGLEHKMDMDCSAVTSAEQLSQVFSAFLPFPTFRELRIEGNQHLREIRRGDLGPASFQRIHIVDGILSAVDHEALNGSYLTLSEMSIAHNTLFTFPFDEIPSFSSLTNLRLYSNSLQTFPNLESQSLRDLSLGNNRLQEIPGNAFAGLPGIRSLYFYANDIKEIAEGTFSTLAELSHLELYQNRLRSIPEGAIRMAGNGHVYLYNNNISKIAEGGIEGIGKGILSLNKNSLATFEEDVFRPILEGGATVYIDENPFGCGCDVAWLITNSGFMGRISSEASCFNGELLADLDPGIYEDLCT